MGNYVTAPPSEALLISGVNGTKIVVGSTVFRFWVVNKVNRLSLELYDLELHTVGAETVQGVRISVTAIANVKVKARVDTETAKKELGVEPNPDKPLPLDKRSINLAAQHFLNQKVDIIKQILTQTLEGHQRQILGTLTVEQVFKDRASFSAKVREHVHEDLEKMGVELVSYSIKELSDENGYLKALGATQTAIVKREAQEGEAKNTSEARQKVSQAESVATITASKATREAHVAANEQKQQEAESDRELDLKRAENLRQVGEAQARAAAAAKIVEARTQQDVIREKTQQMFIEKEVMTKVAEQESKRIQVEVEGQAKARLLAQNNDAKTVVVKAEAEAQRIRIIALAEAEAIKMKGEAEATNIRLKAEAYNQFNEAALAYHLINQLPEIAAAIAKPLEKTDKITFVSSGGGEGGAPSALTKDITNIMAQLPSTVHALTGFNLRKAIGNDKLAIDEAQL